MRLCCENLVGLTPASTMIRVFVGQVAHFNLTSQTPAINENVWFMVVQKPLPA